VHHGIITAVDPDEEPVSLPQAKTHCRVEHDADNAFLAELVKAARELTEATAERRWVTQTVKVAFGGFPGWDGAYPFPGVPAAWVPGGAAGGPTDNAIRLPVGPLQTLTAVRYYATDGTLTTLAGCDTWLDHVPPLIGPPLGSYWPGTQAGKMRAVEVEAVAGYGAAAAVPRLAKQAVLLTVGYWYEHRGDDRDPNAVAAISAELGLPPGALRLIDLLRTKEYR
jgi:uncharacterized phiE125 gp8 family phage protein